MSPKLVEYAYISFQKIWLTKNLKHLFRDGCATQNIAAGLSGLRLFLNPAIPLLKFVQAKKSVARKVSRRAREKDRDCRAATIDPFKYFDALTHT